MLRISELMMEHPHTPSLQQMGSGLLAGKVGARSSSRTLLPSYVSNPIGTPAQCSEASPR